MVFLKRSTNWNDEIIHEHSPRQQLLSKSIESLIDEVHEATLRVINSS